MPDSQPPLTSTQEALLDAHKATVTGETESGVTGICADGRLIEVTAEGDVFDLDDKGQRLPPPEIAPEVLEPTDVEEPSESEDGESPDAFRPPEVALAVDTRDPADVYRAMDRADEELILDELMGRAIEAMVYSFKGEGGQLMTDLTVAGVNETIRLMNERGGTQIGISPSPPVVDEFREGDKDYYRVLVFGRDARYPESGRWAAAIEPKMMELRKGGTKWDKFALTKALNKAQRNALRAFIPEEFRQAIIAQFLGEGRIKVLKPLGGGAVAELPPALDDEKAQTIKAEIHEAWGELKKLNRLRMPPARFNGFLTRAETESHERMEVFRDQVRELVDQEKQLASEGSS